MDLLEVYRGHHVVVEDVYQEDPLVARGAEGHDVVVYVAVVDSGKMEGDEGVETEDACDCLFRGMYGYHEYGYHAEADGRVVFSNEVS